MCYALYNNLGSLSNLIIQGRGIRLYPHRTPGVMAIGKPNMQKIFACLPWRKRIRTSRIVKNDHRITWLAVWDLLCGC